MELAALVRLMRDHFAVYSETTSRPYAVRFVGKPYNTFVQGCPTIEIMTHKRGPNVSPFSIKAILVKFGISEEAFMSAHGAFLSHQLVLGEDSRRVN